MGMERKVLRSSSAVWPEHRDRILTGACQAAKGRERQSREVGLGPVGSGELRREFRGRLYRQKWA